MIFKRPLRSKPLLPCERTLLRDVQNTQDHSLTPHCTRNTVHYRSYRTGRQAAHALGIDRGSALSPAAPHGSSSHISASSSTSRPPQSQRSSPGSKEIARTVLPRAQTTGANRRALSTRAAATSKHMQSRACSGRRWQTQAKHAAHLRPQRTSPSNFSTSPTAAASRYWSLSANDTVWFSTTSQGLSIIPAHDGMLSVMSE